MQARGLTRAATMGPVADLVRRSGGRVDPLFRRSGLSPRLLEEPERLILLRDQFRLVESAARAVGDDGFGARLSVEVGFAGLGRYAHRIQSSGTLGEAVTRVNTTIADGLQSATRTWVERCGRDVRWNYCVTEPVELGRQQNELLALGYQLSLLRGFAGARWRPVRIEIPEVRRPVRVAAEAAFGCAVVPGECAAVVFPMRVLTLVNPLRITLMPPERSGDAVPDTDDLTACAERVLEAVLLERRPTLRDLAERLQMRPRTLQRRLAAEGETFDSLLRRTLWRRADELLADGHSVTGVAVELGYSDTAHFSRAYRVWTGRPPSSAIRSPRPGLTGSER